MGFAIRPSDPQSAADMRCAIDRPCRPAALIAVGLDERDAVDRKESLDLLHDVRAAILNLRKLVRGLFRWGRGASASSRFFRDLLLPKLPPLGRP